jgi:hypothetical protein
MGDGWRICSGWLEALKSVICSKLSKEKHEIFHGLVLACLLFLSTIHKSMEFCLLRNEWIFFHAINFSLLRLSVLFFPIFSVFFCEHNPEKNEWQYVEEWNSERSKECCRNLLIFHHSTLDNRISPRAFTELLIFQHVTRHADNWNYKLPEIVERTFTFGSETQMHLEWIRHEREES